MRFYIKQKVFSIGDKYVIKNENGEDIFFVRGKILTLSPKFYLLDMSNNEQSFIEKELFSFLLPKYNIYRNNQLLACIKKTFTFLKSSFEVDSSSGTYVISGDFMSMSFDITHNGLRAATITKKWFTWGDSYEIDISYNEDETLLLSMVIIIDNCLHNQNNNSFVSM